MIDLNTFLEQAKLCEKAVSEIQNQNRIFENIIQEAVKGAPEEHKGSIEKIRILSKKAINLAKQGKVEEAQNLIKSFKDGN